ncbi:MAG TPA: pyridoxal-dependent decarboxylase [Steroidobacteraceae bacterium]
MSDESVRELLIEAANRAAAYLEGLREREVGPLQGAIERLTDALDVCLPDESTNAAEVLAFLDTYGSPATVASAGGRYFGFVTGGALPVTVATQYIAAGWDQNCMSFVASPAVACFEASALRWVKEALGLPSSSEGALVTGATMANFTCLAAARNQILGKHGWDADRRGLFGAPPITVVLGDEAHASLYKVVSMLGIGRDRVLRVPTDTQGRMRADRLPPIDGPVIVCLQAGNVNTGAFDPADEIIAWAHDHGAWAHVDGAFGLWALALPEVAAGLRAFLDADSWATDAHKWLNVPYDSGIALVRDREALVRAMSISGSYLMLADGRRDAINLGPDSSRRARALEVWAALKCLGRSGLTDLVMRNCRQAREMADKLTRAGIEILNEVALNQVVVAFEDDARTKQVIAKVQDRGACWCGGTTWRGRAAMRISVSSWATTDEDIECSAAAIVEAYRSLRQP